MSQASKNSSAVLSKAASGALGGISSALRRGFYRTPPPSIPLNAGAITSSPPPPPPSRREEIMNRLRALHDNLNGLDALHRQSYTTFDESEAYRIQEAAGYITDQLEAITNATPEQLNRELDRAEHMMRGIENRDAALWRTIRQFNTNHPRPIVATAPPSSAAAASSSSSSGSGSSGSSSRSRSRSRSSSSNNNNNNNNNNNSSSSSGSGSSSSSSGGSANEATARALAPHENDNKFLTTLKTKIPSFIGENDFCNMTQAQATEVCSTMIDKIIKDKLGRIAMFGFTQTDFYKEMMRAYTAMVADLYSSGMINTACTSPNRNLALTRLIIDSILAVDNTRPMGIFIFDRAPGLIAESIVIIKKSLTDFQADLLGARAIWMSYFASRGGRRRLRSRRRRTNRRNTRRRR